uniref:Uncharacterized protein n=1 Tax=Avena sativa TaxID=4498 RepID=A0ACD5VZ08_AVESA
MAKDNTKHARLCLLEDNAVERSKQVPHDVAKGKSVAVKPTRKIRTVLGRNRASPARLFKLNQNLSPEQKTLIEEWGWGGMIKVQAKEMPVDLSMWVLSCFEPIRNELAIPGRGTIPVNADSYTKVFGIPNEGQPICYEMEAEAIEFLNREYNIESGSAPEWADWCKMIKNMGGVADLKFLRAYFASAISCFVCPTTASSISPRCYRSLVDLNLFRRTNFAQFAVDQISTQILYLDSMEVDEVVQSKENCPVRAKAWNDKLIQAITHKNSKGNGDFGKLRLKEGVGANITDGLFVGMTRTEDFVSSKLPRSFPYENKRKIVVMLGELCMDISIRLGCFVEAIGTMESAESSSHAQARRKRQRIDRGDGDDGDDEDNSDNNEDDES